MTYATYDKKMVYFERRGHMSWGKAKKAPHDNFELHCVGSEFWQLKGPLNLMNVFPVQWEIFKQGFAQKL